MSEYQYYEFAAVDRQLTRTEMEELRSVSTRAVITPSGFTNHYEWGDLKADPADWMRRYFDGFVHTANWCSCRLALRVPLATFGKGDLKPFATRHALTIEAGKEHWLIDWSLDESQDYERFSMEGGSGWMRRLLPLRDELLRGDLRPLYIGWLAAAGAGELRDTAPEPEAPPGLSTLSAPQQALVEFMEVDPDMLAAAAAGSASAPEADSGQDARVESWLGEWSRDDMASVLKLIAQGQASTAERQVKARYAAWLKSQHPSPAPHTQRRSLAQLRELAQSAAQVRLKREAADRAALEIKHRQQRDHALRLLMADVDKHWSAIDALAQRGTASGYEQAVRTLVDLAEGYALTSSRAKFDSALRHWLVRHATRGALLRRLKEADLWSE
jgi:hypothetical protein